MPIFAALRGSCVPNQIIKPIRKRGLVSTSSGLAMPIRRELSSRTKGREIVYVRLLEF